ncbi:MAG: preprotein translocase subunit SecY [Chloroflexota bacterium]|nr:preprotein translocase subunit SecY [Chloroflexota bacterium]
MTTAQEGAARPKLLQAAIDAFRVPDLRAKILFTLAMLALFRFIAHIPVPGVSSVALDNLFRGGTATGQLMGFLDVFSGGALRNMSIAALGVYPYITSTIVIQMLTPVIPPLQRLAKEGEAGRLKMNRITHWLTVPIAMANGYGQLLLLQQSGVVTSVSLTGEFALPTIAAILSLTAGTMFLVWVGELITERGIGNGVSIIIFGGIVSNFPTMIGQGFLERNNIGGVFIFTLIALGIVYVIVLFTEAHRRVPVQYGRSVFRGGRMYRQTGGTHIPLRVNSAGMIPLIFAFSIMILPSTIASYLSTSGGGLGDAATWFVRNLGITAPAYWVLTFLLVVIFTFFYTMVVFSQQNIAENLQKNGGFIPGIRPGKPTQEYLNKTLLRITWGGALFLGGVAVLPYIAASITGVQAIQLSSTSLLIMVGVALDTLRQLEAQLLMRHYEGFLR